MDMTIAPTTIIASIVKNTPAAVPATLLGAAGETVLPGVGAKVTLAIVEVGENFRLLRPESPKSISPIGPETTKPLKLGWLTPESASAVTKTSSKASLALAFNFPPDISPKEKYAPLP